MDKPEKDLHEKAYDYVKMAHPHALIYSKQSVVLAYMSGYTDYKAEISCLKAEKADLEAQNKELTENYLKNWNALQDENRVLRESLLWIIDHSKHRLSKFSKEIRGKAEQALKTT